MSLYQKLKFQEQITHQNINILLPQQNFVYFTYVNIRMVNQFIVTCTNILF